MTPAQEYQHWRETTRAATARDVARIEAAGAVMRGDEPKACTYCHTFMGEPALCAACVDIINEMVEKV